MVLRSYNGVAVIIAYYFQLYSEKKTDLIDNFSGDAFVLNDKCESSRLIPLNLLLSLNNCTDQPSHLMLTLQAVRINGSFIASIES